MRLLVVTPYSPPAPTAVAFVVGNLAEQFSPDEMVIASERQPGVATPATLFNGIAVHYVSRVFGWPKRGRKYFRWMRWLPLPLVVARLARIIRQKQCDVALVVFPDEFMLCAGMLAARLTGVRFFPWYHNTYMENRRGLSGRFAQWLQPRTFREAELVFVMSEGMQRAWERRYDNIRFVPLTHAFNGPAPVAETPPAGRKALRLAFLGNFNESNADALRRVRDLVEDTEDCTLTIISGTPAYTFAKFGVAGPSIHKEQVSDEELLPRLREFDMLVLPHGLAGGLAPIEYETIFPTRTIPYLLSQRPILAHTPPDCFLTNWLRRHDCAEIVDQPDLEALRRAMHQLQTDDARRAELVRNGVEAVKQFQGERVAQGLRDVLRVPAAPL